MRLHFGKAGSHSPGFHPSIFAGREFLSTLFVPSTSGFARMRGKVLYAPAMPPIPEDYRPYLDRIDLPESDKLALIQIIEAITDSFADWAFGLDPASTAGIQKGICKDDIEKIDLSHDPADPQSN